jgi:negative regulator of flagellin synthesis FlgM
MTGIPQIASGSVARIRAATEPAGRTATERTPYPGDARSESRRESDRVEVSDLAIHLSKLKSLPDIRQDLVDRVKSEITSGTYETPDKIEWAIEQVGGEVRA